MMSQSRNRSRGLRSAGSGRRSQSVGPALRLDRVKTAEEEEGKGKSIFKGRKRRGRELGEQKEKGGRCMIM